MVKTNFHAHTIHCDGQNTAREMVEAALREGMTALGFSGHSVTPFDLRYCIQPDGEAQYVADIQKEREAFAGQIEIYIGIEDDIFGQRPSFRPDFVIGGTSFLEVGGCHYTIDENEPQLCRCVREAFGGDFYKMSAHYFSVMAGAKDVTNCDFVAHFDLITKFNEDGHLFDVQDPRYRKPALEALEHLCSQGLCFEINTGGMSRGYRTAPYPDFGFLKAIREFGGSIVINSDSHCARHIFYRHDLAVELALEAGFRSQRILTPTGWQDVGLI